MNTSERRAVVGKLIASALALGFAAAVIVYVVAKWQIENGQASASSRLASALIAEMAGQPGVPAAPAPAPTVSLLWPGITGLAVAVVVVAAGIVYMATDKK